jgi:outer membrane biosynthesis protein TonB
LARVRLLWVPLLLAPAGVVFVGTRTTIDPIARAERLDVVPHIPVSLELPTAAVGITTPSRHVTVRVRTRKPAVHRHVAKRTRPRIAPAPVRAPKPMYVVPKTVVARIVPTVTPQTVHTPTPKPSPTPTPTPPPPPPPAPAPEPTPTPTTPEPTPPVQPPPPSEPPVQPVPTPAAPPPPAPAPPAPTTPTTGDDDGDQGEDTDGNGDTRPGNGWGDQNHEHTGPPGHDGSHGRHGRDHD